MKANCEKVSHIKQLVELLLTDCFLHLIGPSSLRPFSTHLMFFFIRHRIAKFTKMELPCFLLHFNSVSRRLSIRSNERSEDSYLLFREKS